MKIFSKILFISVLLTAVPAGAEIPTVLTDKIRNGSDVIDVFKDASGAELQDYLLANFSPFSTPGVHVIFEATSDAMSPAYFARESERIVTQLHQMYAEVSQQTMKY